MLLVCSHQHRAVRDGEHLLLVRLLLAPSIFLKVTDDVSCFRQAAVETLILVLLLHQGARRLVELLLLLVDDAIDLVKLLLLLLHGRFFLAQLLCFFRKFLRSESSVLLQDLQLLTGCLCSVACELQCFLRLLPQRCRRV